MYETLQHRPIFSYDYSDDTFFHPCIRIWMTKSCTALVLLTMSTELTTAQTPEHTTLTFWWWNPGTNWGIFRCGGWAAPGCPWTTWRTAPWAGILGPQPRWRWIDPWAPLLCGPAAQRNTEVSPAAGDEQLSLPSRRHMICWVNLPISVRKAQQPPQSGFCTELYRYVTWRYVHLFSTWRFYIFVIIF